MKNFTPEQAIEIIDQSKIKARSNLGHRTQMPTTALSLTTALCGLSLGVMAAPALPSTVLISAFAAVPALLVMAVSEIFIVHEENEIVKGSSVALNRYCDMRDLAYIVQTLEANAKKPMPPASDEQGATQSQTKPQSKSSNPMEAGSALIEKSIQLDEAAPHLGLGGRTREGKSETLKYLLRDESQVNYVTSKATDEVPTDWQGVIAAGSHRVAVITRLLDIWEERLEGHLEGRYTDREWFVIDEAVGICKSLEAKKEKELSGRLKAFIIEVITAGAGVNAFIALLSQTGNSGPLGIDLDLLKNLSIVSCSKRKRKDMVSYYTKMTGTTLLPEQIDQINSLEGYWQLWEDNGQPRLSQIEPVNIPMKSCLTWKAFLEESPAENDKKSLTRNLPLSEQKAIILEFLIDKKKPMTAKNIRDGKTQSRDGSNRLTQTAIQQLLTKLEGEQKVKVVMVGDKPHWQVSHIL